MIKDSEIPQTKKSPKSRGISSNTQTWLKEMAQKDTALWGMPRPLWVMQNKMYDLEDFAKRHPGGKSWITLTKGQDITVLFRTHHLDYQKSRKLLDKYYVGQAPIQNPDRFQFNNHFENIRKILLSKYSPRQLQSTSKTQKRCYIFVFIWFLFLTLCGFFSSYILAILCGYLSLLHYAIGHLFIHKKDSKILRHLNLLIGFTAEQQQIMHALSHHPYTNTLLDYQYGAVEPLIYFSRNLPENKWYTPYVFQLLFLLVSPSNIITKLIVAPIQQKTLPSLPHMVMFIQIVYLRILCGDWAVAFGLWAVMTLSFGFWFGKKLLCPHRQPQLWSEGAEEIKDFVIHNVVSSTDYDHQCSYLESMLLYGGFNIHILHHLFPTIDHMMLKQSNDLFMEYCNKNGIKVHLNKLPQCNINLFKLMKKRVPFCLQMFSKSKE